MNINANLFYNVYCQRYNLFIYTYNFSKYTLSYTKIRNKYIPLTIRNNFKTLPQSEIIPIFTLENQYPHYKTKQQMLQAVKSHITI